MLSMTNLRLGGLRGVGSPPLWGPGQRLRIFFFGPYIRLGEPTYGFRSMVLEDGFRSMVLDSLTCIYMYCNIERNKIMKNQAGSPGFGI